MNKKNFALLGTIVAAMANAATPYHLATPTEVAPLAKEGLVETNPDIKDGDKVAVRASDKGVAFHADAANVEKFGAAAAATPRPKPELTVGSGFVVPEGLAKTKTELYPFETLVVGGFIFVPTSESKPDPVKSLASTVSAATKRYAVEIKGKTRVDRKGNTVAATKNTRVFTLVPVKSGVDYGTFKAPADGAAIVRLPDHVEAPEATGATA